MEKKKILIVSASFYPVKSPRSFRTTELVKEFSRQGHDVTLITPKNEEIHRSFEEEYQVNIKDLGNRYLPVINTSNGTAPGKMLRRAMRRGMNLFFEYPDIEFLWRVKKELIKEAGYDLMISIAVPHPVHWGVAFARNSTRPIAKTWIADCGDPYMGASFDSFNKLFYFKYLEKYFCRKADFISIPKMEMKANYYKEFHGKMVEIPQGFNFDDVTLSVYNKNRIPTFGYAGSFLRLGRNPESLLKALVEIDMEFRFIVYTKDTHFLKPFIPALGDKLEIRDYVPREVLLSELSKMDFLINIGYDTARQMPSKLIDYFITGRPVFSYQPGSFDKNRLHAFLNGNFSSQLKCEDLDKFRIGNVCSRFLHLTNQSKI